MDDAVGAIVFVLIGILAIFFIVRVTKFASRTVDREQGDQSPRSSTSVLHKLWQAGWGR
jgi:F0F1-type ATP synthase assembly protein I